MRNLNKQVVIHIFISLLILIFIYLFYLVTIEYDILSTLVNTEKTSKVLAYVSTFIIIYYFLLWGSIVNSRLNLFSIFLISFYLFTLGQPLLFALNLEPTILFERESIHSIVISQFYSIICIVSFFIGSLLTVVKTPENDTKNIKKEKINYLVIFRNVGIFLFIVSLPFTIYYLFEKYKVTASLGYGAFYNDDAVGSLQIRISSHMSKYFVMSLLLLMIGYKNNKTISKIITFIIVGFALSLFTIGDRATPTSILLIVLWFKTNILKSVSLKGNVRMLLLVLVLMFIYPIIGDLRSDGAVGISSIKTKQDEENFIVESIGTFGYSMFPLMKTMEIIPETESYHYGSSYLFSLTSIIPNISNGEHIAAKHASLAEWLKVKLKTYSGQGYSMPAEAYYNFGWFPVPIMILLGIFFASFLTLKENDKENYIKLFIVFAFFYMNITAPRNPFLGMVRDIFYIILPIYIILIMYKSKIIRNFHNLNHRKKI